MRENQQRSCDILVIEDDKPTIRLLKTYFKHNGYHIEPSLTGKEGIEKARILNPKLILIDILLGDINGYEVCNIIKHSEGHRDTPIYFITALPVEEVLQKMEETPASGVFFKPFDLDEFDLLCSLLEGCSSKESR